MLKNFRTYQLAIEFYKSSKTLRLKGPSKDQFERASLSIPLNLAEGSAKTSEKEREKFYRTALGSLREVQTILELYGPRDLIDQADRLAAHCYKLCYGTRGGG